MSVLYTDNGSYVCAWLANILAAEHLPPAAILQRDVEHLTAADVEGYQQVHFFAGTGAWGLAAARACWPLQIRLWTMSLPCQPFSRAGMRRGMHDERNVWEPTFDLIQECTPRVIVGEQVWSKDTEDWWAQVSADLERAGYEVQGSVVEARMAGSPHIRERLYWRALGNTDRNRREAEVASLALKQATDKLGAAGLRSQEWRPAGKVRCPWDGAERSHGPSASLLVDGTPARMAQLCAIGNAILPTLGAAALAAVLEELAT